MGYPDELWGWCGGCLADHAEYATVAAVKWGRRDTKPACCCDRGSRRGRQPLVRPDAQDRYEECINCGSGLRQGTQSWLWYCPACRLEKSLLNSARFNGTDLIGWSSDSEAALTPLRRSNARRALDALATLGPLEGWRVLDVGSAAGWFMEAARNRGMMPFGIEPDAQMTARARAKGLEVANGFFPDAVPKAGNFQLVAFNDVFEHLPNPGECLAAARGALSEGGCLLLTLPTSRGAMYAVARLAGRFGYVRLPFIPLTTRLFQESMRHVFVAIRKWERKFLRI